MIYFNLKESFSSGSLRTSNALMFDRNIILSKACLIILSSPCTTCNEVLLSGSRSLITIPHISCLWLHFTSELTGLGKLTDNIWPIIWNSLRSTEWNNSSASHSELQFLIKPMIVSTTIGELAQDLIIHRFQSLANYLRCHLFKKPIIDLAFRLCVESMVLLMTIIANCGRSSVFCNKDRRADAHTYTCFNTVSGNSRPFGENSVDLIKSIH
jgi:hypothetical protein